MYDTLCHAKICMTLYITSRVWHKMYDTKSTARSRVPTAKVNMIYGSRYTPYMQGLLFDWAHSKYVFVSQLFRSMDQYRIHIALREKLIHYTKFILKENEHY